MGENSMKRSRYVSAALVLLEIALFVYEYPGKLVLRDIARLKTRTNPAGCSIIRRF
jgi:hypothetical protein